MIKITLECEDAELASYLILLYEIYTREEMDMSLGLLRSQLVPALGYLFDKLTDNYIDEKNIIVDSSNTVHGSFSEADWDFLCKIFHLSKDKG